MISFCSLLSISLLHLQFPFLSSCLFFKRPQLSLPPSVPFLFSPLVLSSSSLHLTGFVSGGIVWGVSFWQLIEGLLGRAVLFFFPARLSAVCSAVWPGWRGHDIHCGNLYLMLPCHSKERRQQRPRWGLPLNYILLTGSLFCSCHSITLRFASNAKHPDLALVTWHESVLLSLFTEKQFLLFRLIFFKSGWRRFQKHDREHTCRKEKSHSARCGRLTGLCLCAKALLFKDWVHWCTVAF